MRVLSRHSLRREGGRLSEEEEEEEDGLEESPVFSGAASCLTLEHCDASAAAASNHPPQPLFFTLPPSRPHRVTSTHFSLCSVRVIYLSPPATPPSSSTFSAKAKGDRPTSKEDRKRAEEGPFSLFSHSKRGAM